MRSCKGKTFSFARAGFPANRWSVIAGGAFYLLLVLTVPIASAFRFGGDEGYELMKAMLLLRGYPLYDQIWNDQPPVYTALLAILFLICGESLRAARVLSIFFGLGVILVVSELARRAAGSAAALLSTLVLLSWPPFLRLSVSVMLEMPAMAFSLLALLLVDIYRANPNNRLCICTSGFIYGMALQTKFTSIVFLPAILMAIAIACACSLKLRRWSFRDIARKTFYNAFALWIVSCLCGFWLIVVVFPGELAGTVITSHFSSATRTFSAQQNLNTAYLYGNWDLWLWPTLAVACMCLIKESRGALLIPGTLLLTVSATHLVNRPFWYYYGLHFAIPISILTGISLGKVAMSLMRACEGNTVRQVVLKPGFIVNWYTVARASALTLILSGVIVYSANRLAFEWLRLRAAPKVNEYFMVKLLKANAPATNRWLFTEDLMYAVHAGLIVPPEVAIIPAKRRWSGQISEEYVEQQLLRYLPGQIYLSSEMWTPVLSTRLLTNYVVESGLANRYFRVHGAGPPKMTVGRLSFSQSNELITPRKQ